MVDDKRVDLPASPWRPGSIRDPRRLGSTPTLPATRPEQHAAAFVFDNSGGSPTVQSIPNNTVTTLTWNTALFDTHGIFNNGTDQFIIPSTGKITGLWVVHALVAWEAGATGYRELRITQNAVPRKSRVNAQNISDQTQELLAYVRDPNAGDTFTAQVIHTQGAALNISKADATGLILSYFEIFHLW